MTQPDPFPGPAYKIHTQRLVIRCMDPADAPMQSIAIEQSLEHLLPWAPWAKQEPLTLQARIELLRGWRGDFDLGIDFEYGLFDPTETVFLGCVRLNPHDSQEMREIGYWIHKDHINKGLATEASAALTKVAFEIDHVNRVEIHCDPNNLRSASVPRKLGFTHEATLRSRVKDPLGNLHGRMIWTLFVEDYPGSPSSNAEIQAFDAISRRII